MRTPRTGGMLALVLALGLGAPAAAHAATGPPSPAEAATGPTSVHDDLAAEIAETGAAEAVVTTFDRDGLAAARATGIDGATLTTLPMVLVPELTGEQLDRLEATPQVRSVWANERAELHMQESTHITGARDVWEGLGLDDWDGATGQGVELAVVDTGAFGLHADFDGLVEFCDASTGASHELDHPLVVCHKEREAAVDDFGHGTHVAGTMAGTGDGSGGPEAPHSTTGMAPDARVRSYSANAGAFLLTFDILASYDDLITKRLRGRNEVVAVNNSFGGGTGTDYNPDDPQHVAYTEATRAGMLVVFSAGNDGPERNTLGQQCLNPYVLCVGASTKPDGLAGFSSVGRSTEPGERTESDPLLGPLGVEQTVPTGPDNHDRQLAQALDLGLYRPSIVAPGAAINSMSLATGAGCTEGAQLEREACYEELQGTSMSSPHVTGAAALVVEAWRDAGHPTRVPRRGTAEEVVQPSPADLIEIFERTAVTMPGFAPEQVGAGRLDVAAAVELARQGPEALTGDDTQTTLGSPPVATTEPETITQQVGCTGAATFKDPVPAERTGTQTIDVPAGTERLEVTVAWEQHPTANLYPALYRPGVDPAGRGAEPGPERVFPDTEDAGLLDMPLTERTLEVPAPEAGEWTLTVAHRAGDAPQPCPADAEGRTPPTGVGFVYDAAAAATSYDTDTPEVAFTAEDGDGVVELEGRATYPDPVEGATTWAVPGSGLETASDDVPAVERFFDGDRTDAVTKDGDIVAERPDREQPLTQTAESSLANPDFPYNPVAITWTGEHRGPIGGDLGLEWYWTSPNAPGQVIGVAAEVTVFADPVAGEGEQPEAVIGREETVLQVGPDTEPVRNVTTVPIDPHKIDERLQVQVVPVFADTGPGLTAVYGSESALSRVTIRERTTDPPQDVRVTDLTDALRVEWTPVADADDYEVHAAADPAFEPGEATRLDVEPACDGEVCRVVDEVGARQTRYYRVLADGDPAAASLLAPGTTQPIDREVLVRADTIYGPGYWQRAEATEGATAWRFRYVTAGLADPADPLARAFSQGVGSPATAASEPGDPGGPGRRKEPGPPDHADPPGDSGGQDRGPPRDPVPGDRPPPRGPDG